MRVGCVLMAAGLAARFGENKLLARIDGRSLLARALSAAPAGLFARAVAVISAEAVQRAAEAAGYMAVVNPAPQRGQGTTIALGIGAMAGLDAAMFCVADQPFLTRADVERLLGAYAPGQICALAYGGRRGNPVIFPADLFAELAALLPEETGRAVIRRHPDRLRLVEAGSALALADVDTQADLRLLQEEGQNGCKQS